jgi:hypothetical protein
MSSSGLDAVADIFWRSGGRLRQQPVEDATGVSTRTLRKGWGREWTDNRPARRSLVALTRQGEWRKTKLPGKYGIVADGTIGTAHGDLRMGAVEDDGPLAAFGDYIVADVATRGHGRPRLESVIVIAGDDGELDTAHAMAYAQGGRTEDDAVRRACLRQAYDAAERRRDAARAEAEAERGGMTAADYADPMRRARIFRSAK